MRLVRTWRLILARAWSIRLIALSVVLTSIEVAMPFLHGVLDVPAGVFAALAGLSSGAAMIARVIAQKDVPEA